MSSIKWTSSFHLPLLLNKKATKKTEEQLFLRKLVSFISDNSSCSFQNFKTAQRGQQVEGKISNQHYLHSYLSYIKLSKTIERNLLLIENLKNYLPGGLVEEGRKITKPQDLVRLYDIIIQVFKWLSTQLQIRWYYRSKNVDVVIFLHKRLCFGYSLEVLTEALLMSTHNAHFYG